MPSCVPKLDRFPVPSQKKTQTHNTAQPSGRKHETKSDGTGDKLVWGDELDLRAHAPSLNVKGEGAIEGDGRIFN